MKVLVTGAGGMLGHDVVTAADAVHHEVVGLARTQLDVTDAAAVQKAFEREQPRAVINCAAFTAVDKAQEEPDNAEAVNVTGAANVARSAASVGAKVIYVSTDYVFDGRKGEPYIETDPTNPLSVYGKTKLAGEQATAENCEEHIIVRSSWLFGMHGPNFVETMLALAARLGEVLVVNDQTGSPTYTGHLAQRLVELLDSSDYGVHHVVGDGACTWWEFANEIFRQGQVECRVMAGTTAMLARPAPRPEFSVLATARPTASPLPPWDHGLHDYLVARAASGTDQSTDPPEVS